MEMKMTRQIAILAISAMLFSCSTKKTEHKLVAPLPAGIDVENLQDCMIPVSFMLEDFNWEEGKLSLTVYNKDLYDAVEVSQLQVGDTLFYDEYPIVINKIVENGGGIEINDGHIDEGGCCLSPYEGGTYVARHWDTHATYTELGKAEVDLADNLVIINCGEFPNDLSDTICSEQRLYIENLKDSNASFFSLNTLVTIENGKITEINRRWIP